MPVTENTSNLFPDQHAGEGVLDALVLKGVRRVAIGNVVNVSTDLLGSIYHLADIPSHAILDEATFFGVAAWGFAQIQIGTETDADALVDQTKVTEDVVTPIAIADAFHGKRLWEVLGLAEDPRGNIGIYAHAAADAASAGAMTFRVAWVDNG